MRCPRRLNRFDALQGVASSARSPDHRGRIGSIELRQAKITLGVSIALRHPTSPTANAVCVERERSRRLPPSRWPTGARRLAFAIIRSSGPTTLGLSGQHNRHEQRPDRRSRRNGDRRDVPASPATTSQDTNAIWWPYVHMTSNRFVSLSEGVVAPPVPPPGSSCRELRNLREITENWIPERFIDGLTRLM